MSNPVEASGQVALVTGASRGIGRAIALALAAKGFRVVGTATTDAGAAAISEALAAHDGCRGIVLDVTAGDAAAAAIDAVVRDSGALHVLVNNAGITRDTLSMRMKDDDWDAVLATNLTAVFRASRAALRPMMKQRYGRIVNITSVVGASGNPGQANYAAAKAGVTGLTKALSKEWGRLRVNVNTVAFGLIRTRLTEATADTNAQIDIDGRGIKVGVNPDLMKVMEAQIPLGRAGTPEEAAGAVYLFCTPESNYISGQTVVCGGGFSLS